MAQYSVGGKEFNLVLSLYAMEAIEHEYGDIKQALEMFRSKKRNIGMIKNMFRILANAGRHADGQPEDVTGGEIDNLTLKGLDLLSNLMKNTMDESLRTETVGGGEADDEAADVYAEQMAEQEKNA